MSPDLRPRARVRDVLAGRAALIGARLDGGRPGLISPLEPPLLLGLHLDDPAAVERDHLARRSLRADLGLLVALAVAAVLAPSRRRPAPARPFVVSAAIDNLTADEAIGAILAAPPRDRARVVHFAHPHALNLAVRDPALRDALARADLVLGDGVGLRLGAALLGMHLRANLNGTDLINPLVRRAAAQGIPVALVGGGPGVAATAAERLREEAPGLSTPIVRDGFLGAPAARVLAGQLAELGARGPVLVLVGMGSPLQEQFVWRHLAELPGVIVVTVGGLFDFVAGRIPRAPLAWRRVGLEWVYRLIQEPRRMARRYLLGNPLFVARVLGQRVGQALRRRPG